MFNTDSPLNLKVALPVLVASNQVQTLKTTGSQARPSDSAPNPVASSQAITTPGQVQSVQVQVVKASDISSKVTVTYQRNPQDYLFVDARVFVSGYKGNPAPTQVASGQSPVSFSLENTGEPVTVTVQASGNLGQAPLSTAPTTTFQLTKTPLATTPTAAGNGTAGSATFQTAGVNNSSQTLLNHTTSDSSLVVANTSGGIENFTLLQFLKSSPGFILSGTGGYYRQDGGGTGRWGTGTANEVLFWTVEILYPFTVKTLYWRHNTSLAGSHSAFGIYSADGTTKHASWDNFDTNVGAGNKSQALGSAVSLPPGIYTFACGCDTTGTAPGTQGGYVTLGSSESTAPWNIGSIIRSGKGSNAMSSGALPSAIGTRSLIAFPADVPCVLMEPS